MSYDLQLGHCLDLIPQLPDGSVDLVVTSPPWWGQDYEAPLIEGWGRLGHETDSTAYAGKICRVVAALRPKLKREALVWLIVADVPDSTGRLSGIPYLVGRGEHGLIWTYTWMWIWTSSLADTRMPTQGPLPASTPIVGLSVDPEYHYWRGQEPDWIAADAPHEEKGVPWATLPPGLVRVMVETSCRDGGTVLDPFCGSGTVVGVAHALDRHGVGMDLSESTLRGARRKVRRMAAQMEGARRGAQQETGGMVRMGGDYTEMGRTGS